MGTRQLGLGEARGALHQAADLFVGVALHIVQDQHLAIAIRQVYGRKKDPYQADEDRMRQIEFTLRTLLLVSIAVTVYAALGVTLKAFGLDSLTPISTSLYYQLLAVMSFREFRIDNVNFEVYREEPVAA